uniref:Uncharacterized protein n=1 Tax=Trichobilharzia regenti TaxID=157069 RepID=A0AA85J342_TRIRE|nr:unnamed protein product [Trichobilharzia regenti]
MVQEGTTLVVHHIQHHRHHHKPPTQTPTHNNRILEPITTTTMDTAETRTPNNHNTTPTHTLNNRITDKRIQTRCHPTTRHIRILALRKWFLVANTIINIDEWMMREDCSFECEVIPVSLLISEK